MALFAKLEPMSTARFPALALTTALLVPTGASAADPTSWRLDPVHTQVVFYVDHLGFSNGIGRVRIRDGWLRFDAGDWNAAAVEVVLALDTLDMGDPKWSRTVRSAQFLDVERWPEARFTSTSVDQVAPDRAIVHGTLELRGVGKPVALDVTFNRIGRDPYAFRTKAGFSAQARLDRFDFGIERYRDVVGADVELRIELEAIRDPKATDKGNSDAPEEH